MPDNTTDRNDTGQIAAQLRLLAARADNRRHLRAMPQFRVDAQLPGEFEYLLKRLDEAESAL